MPNCKACGSWFAAVNKREHLCPICESALARLTGYAAPIVYGRWVCGKCSNCGVDIPTDDSFDIILGRDCHFCYSCGAKMNGGTENA